MAKRDPRFLEEIRKLPCLSCGKPPPNEVHHIKTRGAGGGDDWWNCVPACQGCHTQNSDGYAWHRGRTLFLKNHPHVLEHLQKLGWELIGDKLIRSQVDI